MIDVCVIGAGVAGLSAAQELTKRGLEVVVLEKSRGLGGRAATRRIAGNRVDHGAQYFTARDERFQQRVAAWLEAGQVAVWNHGFHRLHDDGSLETASGAHARYVFPAGMNALGKLLAEGLDVRLRTRATGVWPAPGGWRLDLEGSDSLLARQVLIGTPAAQALELLGKLPIEPGLAGTLANTAFDPCWAVMAGYAPELAPDWHGVRLVANPVTAWVAHDSSKRPDPPQTVLVLHSTPEFARWHERGSAPTVIREMLAEATVLGDWIARPLWTDSQRWRYALARGPQTDPFLEVDAGLYLCGDWCGGARVEAAYLSGQAVAAKM